jgi:hypothetical protein
MGMSLKKLAEGIILQSIEDLWNENYREDCITFFKGKDFRLCAELAGMELSDQVELLRLVKTSVGSMELKIRKKTGQENGGLRGERTWKKQLALVQNYI